jgi:hypothetical protein
MRLPVDVNSWTKWGIHINRPSWPRSAGRLFLADAADRLGSAMFVEWSSDILGWMLHERTPPLIPAVAQAFVEDRPLPEVHALFGPSVRRIMSVPLYEQLELLRAPIEVWVANLVPDPDGGEPIIRPDLRARQGEGADDPITPGHWEQAFWHAEMQRSEIEGARRYVPLIVAKLVDLAQSGSLKTYARPYGGGDAIGLPAGAWEIDDGTQRLSTCTINPDYPFDPEAPPTHFIFVDAADFEAVAAGIDQMCLVDVSDEDIGPDEAEDGQADRTGSNVLPFGSAQTAIAECAQWLRERFAAPDTSRITKPMFKADALQRYHGRLSGRGFLRAWDIAKDSHPERGEPGPRNS